MINQNYKQFNHSVANSQAEQSSMEVFENMIMILDPNNNNNIKSNELRDSSNNCEKKRKIQKKVFTIQEDTQLISLVNQIGDRNWLEISKRMKELNYERTSRQCRDRYIHYLDPNMSNDLNWSPEEDDLLILTVSKYGNKWKLMENIFPGRSEVALRNRYRKLERKKMKEERKGKTKKNIMSKSFSFLDKLKKPARKRKNVEKSIKSNMVTDIVFKPNSDTKNIKKNESSILDDSNLFSFCDDDDFKAYLF